MTKLCSIADIPEGKSRGFDLNGDGEQDVLVIHYDGKFHAYRNICPHNGAPLNWMPDEFLDPDSRLIQCQNHDALFRIEDGHCVAGPCAGAGLQALATEVRDGELYLTQLS